MELLTHSVCMNANDIESITISDLEKRQLDNSNVFIYLFVKRKVKILGLQFFICIFLRREIKMLYGPLVSILWFRIK